MSPSPLKFAWPLIWINGFPGSGKQTIAKLLATLLEEGGPILIDNHSLIDPVEAKYSRDHPKYQQERRRGRDAVFKTLVDEPDYQSRVIIFTDFQSNNELGRDVAQEYEAAASKANRPFLPIYLECSIQENIRRIQSPQREMSGTTKLLSPGILTEMRSRCQLFRFDTVEEITLDVTNMKPREAAEAVAREVWKYLK